MPPLNSFEELKSDDDNIFISEEENGTYQVNDLYSIVPIADTWRVPSWGSYNIHKSKKAVITNLDVLWSDNQTQNNCNKLSKELSDDNKLCFEIYSVASISISDDADANYTNKVEPHDVVIKISVLEEQTQLAL